MKIFIIHRGMDYDEVEKLKKMVPSKLGADLLSLSSDPDNKNWFAEAKTKIKQCDMALYVLGRETYDSPNVDKEIRYALKQKKQILMYKLYPKEDNRVNAPLLAKDPFTGVESPICREVTIEDFERIFSVGYNFDIAEKLGETKEPKREADLIEQYKVYLTTSEDVLNRRQSTSNFYTTINTSMLTIVVTIAGVLLGLPALAGSLLTVSLILITVGAIGILLNINWLNLLESYGRLNGAKMKVISEIEKSLPANIYDTEWKVMSERLCGERYVSFTSIEKRLPVFFMILFSIMIVFAAVMLAMVLI